MIPEELADEIALELQDERFLDKLHGRRSGVRAGCTGPLCRKYNRDKVRRTYAKRNPNPKRPRTGPRDPELDTILEEIIQIHVESRPLSKAS